MTNKEIAERIEDIEEVILLKQGYRVERINTDRNDKEHRVLLTIQGGGKTRTLIPEKDRELKEW